MKSKLTALFLEFFESERGSGALLLLAAIVSMLLANSPFGKGVQDFWHAKIGFDLGLLHLRYDLLHWTNDGLMAIFFLLIGLEIEREIYIGELSDFKNASLPIFSAIGGMLLPAVIYLFINFGKPAQDGFGIPTATDIAFALGALSLLGSKVLTSVKVFLAAFAIIDDLGAMLMIAFFYLEGFSLPYFLLSLLVFAFLLVLNRRGVNSLPVYLLLGALMWYLMLQSGIHASIAGVLLAFAIPFRNAHPSAPSHRLQHFLHQPVALFIMPLFALANTGLVISGSFLHEMVAFNTAGKFAGLLIGKPLGIVLFALIAIRLGWAKLPDEVGTRELLGIGFLGGIGFTMSIFITILAFGETSIAQSSKIAIMLGSLCSGLIGLFILSRRPSESLSDSDDEPSEQLQS